jgi:hypothetical protein
LPGATPWNGVVLGRSWSNPIPSRRTLTIFSKVVTSASSNANASACSTHSTSQSNACSMDEPTVMTSFGPGIFILR